MHIRTTTILYYYYVQMSRGGFRVCLWRSRPRHVRTRTRTYVTTHLPTPTPYEKRYYRVRQSLRDYYCELSAKFARKNCRTHVFPTFCENKTHFEF